MAQPKTTPNTDSVEEFLNGIPEEERRRDCFTIVELMRQATQADPTMWGSNIVGFGTRHTKYASGREGDWPVTAFSPRKDALTLYITGGFEQYDNLLGQLGKHKIGKACLYIKRLQDIDLTLLKELIEKSVQYVSQTQLGIDR